MTPPRRPPDRNGERPPQPLSTESVATADEQGSLAFSVTDETRAPVDIARGSAGDCCVLCGRVGINLPDEHRCTPNLTAE
jgi:hypothetical protein